MLKNLKFLPTLTRLRWQLMLTYLPLILTPVLVVGLVTRQVTEQGVTLLVSQGAKQQAQMLSRCYTEYYSTHGTWAGLSTVLKTPVVRPVEIALGRSPDQIAQADQPPRPIEPLQPLQPIQPIAPFEPGQPPEPQRSPGDASFTLIRGPLFEFKMDCHALAAPAKYVWMRGFEKSSRVPREPRVVDPIPEAVANVFVDPNSPNSPSPSFPAGDTQAVKIALPEPREDVVALTYAFRNDVQPGDTLVTDPRGVVVASNNNEHLGQTLAGSVLSQGAPLIVDGQPVGVLVIGTALGILDQQQRHLLDAVNMALVFSGALSIILAILLGWGLSGKITGPVKQLMSGVKRLSQGAWSTPLQVQSQNEFGELTGAFNTMASEVTRQQQLTRQMVADIAHDLRTPLAAMSLEIESIEAGFQTPAQATASLREEITCLQRLVEDLRLLSLIDADQVRLQLERTPLHTFLYTVLDFWQTMADESGRCLKAELPADLPLASIDAPRMRQVLGNLIDNAIRHTEPGGTITLGARASDDKIAIWVTDDGEGIAPADLPHVFDRFYRADPSRARGPGRDNSGSSGSGLGLSISRRLVEMHGGAIGVKSTLGRGTTFTIELPHKGTEQRRAAKRVRSFEAGNATAAS
jgi:two-component system sensor histidine kinase BaeS